MVHSTDEARREGRRYSMRRAPISPDHCPAIQEGLVEVPLFRTYCRPGLRKRPGARLPHEVAREACSDPECPFGKRAGRGWAGPAG